MFLKIKKLNGDLIFCLDNRSIAQLHLCQNFLMNAFKLLNYQWKFRSSSSMFTFLPLVFLSLTMMTHSPSSPSLSITTPWTAPFFCPETGTAHYTETQPEIKSFKLSVINMVYFQLPGQTVLLLIMDIMGAQVR